MAESERLAVRLLRAADFAAEKHQQQRRKGAGQIPYINHPLRVARLLAEVGGVDDADVLVAAILHDTLEDTATTAAELAAAFGPTVLALVREVSDDKSLPKAERKRLQIEHAADRSDQATLIKLADKSANVADIGQHPPADWTEQRRREYLDWAEQVVARLRPVNAALLAHFRTILAAARAIQPVDS